MSASQKDTPEATRLEQLWAGEFGDAYVERNRTAGDGRQRFWQDLCSRNAVERILEVGCNIGANLQWLAQIVEPNNVFGLDVNQKALMQLRNTIPEINAIWSMARELPFRDRWFDIVFTTGVLIHQPDSTLPLVMGEIVRCSRKYVLCGEYYSEQPVEVPYRDQQGALFKRDFGQLYMELFPELRLREQGFLSRADGWDDVTYWLFEKA